MDTVTYIHISSDYLRLSMWFDPTNCQVTNPSAQSDNTPDCVNILRWKICVMCVLTAVVKLNILYIMPILNDMYTTNLLGVQVLFSGTNPML